MTPDGNTPFMAVDAPPVRRISLGWILLLMLVVLLFILLILPAEELALPDWYVLLQTQGQALGLMLAPFFAVGLLGAIVAVAELASTFQTYPREALSTRWAQILVFINVVAAALALIVVQITMPEMNPVLRILSVGVGFQALIRTRFVLAKPIDGNEQGEISLNLGWLYDQFQNLCRNQIDLELMNNRRTAVTQLLDYYPTLAELYDIAWYTIIARATLTPEEEQARLDELEKLLDPKAPEQFARTSIALMILENGGQAYVNLLLSQAAHMADAASGTAVTTDSVLRELLQRPLSEIVALAEQVSDVPEILEWVHKAAIPTPDTTEADQKSAVAHFLVQNVGAKRIAEQLAS
ncbi:MAG: hypothetical protein KC415_09205 [Anaerolineales bacterium]|nr:hypothetical protein [Anaerolineales bacterium]MCB8992144.1 hypothetical protein [Ardenticatenaceae bacterium]